jgi:hypothetical protein
MKRPSFLLLTLALLSLPVLVCSETAIYDSDYKAPRCTSTQSPCFVPTSLINGREKISSPSGKGPLYLTSKPGNSRGGKKEGTR